MTSLEFEMLMLQKKSFCKRLQALCLNKRKVRFTKKKKSVVWLFDK